MSETSRLDLGNSHHDIERCFFEWINKTSENSDSKKNREKFFKWLTETMEKKGDKDLVVGIYDGYPERNFDNPETYTSAKVLDADCSKIDRGEITSEEKMGLINGTILYGDLKKKYWAASEKIDVEDRARLESRGDKFDMEGKPINPTREAGGILGRGDLGKWGSENQAVDSINTRYADDGSLEMLMIFRGDTKKWAIPGGFVDYSEDIPTALRRELNEEATEALQDSSEGTNVYSGQVKKDPRNTTQAWIVTEARHRHLDKETGKKVIPRAGDDAKKAEWRKLTPEEIAGMYADHGKFVKRAMLNILMTEQSTMPEIARRQMEGVVAEYLPYIDEFLKEKGK